MILQNATWPEVAAFAEAADERVCLIPTGSLEQHGPHLPLFTDSLLVTAVAEEVERRASDLVLLLPTLWLGASAHHLEFPGSLSATFPGYSGALEAVFASLAKHGFVKFFVVNGHGGNTSPNDIACRSWREAHPGHLVGHGGYFEFIDPSLFGQMKGPWKTIRHACEAETSLMLHVRPDLVRRELAIDDGLRPEPPVKGMVWRFDETTERGVLGAATLATPELGKALFDSAVEGLVSQVRGLAEGVALIGE